MRYLILVALIVLLGAGFGFSKKNDITSNNTDVELNGQTDKKDTTYSSNKILNLSKRNMTKVPMDIFSLVETEELNLSGNNLEGSLPAEVRHLENLKILNLSNNKFTGVPAEIGQLKKLEVLDLSNNSLTGLPYELANLSNLKTLNLSGNNYSEEDLENIKRNLSPSTVIITN